MDKVAEMNEMRDNVVSLASLREATGGPTKPENWLQSLAIGTVFVCRKRKLNPQDNIWLLTELQVVDKYTAATSLVGQSGVPFLVDTKMFSQDQELVEILPV